MHIFSIFGETCALKGVVFLRLFKLCERNDQLKIIIENVKKIEEISKDWAMSVDERKELYRECAVTLDKRDEPVAAFQVLLAYLKLFQKSSEAELSQN